MNVLAEDVESMGQVEHDCLTGTPWEKIGNKIPAGSSVEELLAAADLNWEVIKAPTVIEVEMPYNDYEKARVSEPHRFEAQMNEGSNTVTVRVPNPKSYGLVRSSDMHILSPYMGDRYKPVQNSDAFEVFQEFVNIGGMTMETAGSLCSGEHVWGLANMGKGFELANGETIKGYFLLLQSHSYGHALKAMFTPVRYPGGHTLVQHINLKGVGGKSTYTMSHARYFNDERIQEIKELLGIAEKALEEFQQTASFLANTKFDENKGVHYLVSTFNPELIVKRNLDNKNLPHTLNELMNDEDANRVVKRAAALVDNYPGADLPSCKGTAWGYYNTVAHAFDHAFGHSVDTRIQSSWIGKNRDRKETALRTAEIMATAMNKENSDA